MLLTRLARGLTAALLLAALAACSAEPAVAGGAGPCKVGFLGDGGPPDFDITVLQPDDSVTTVTDGGPVPLVFPPQGGRVVFVGVRATNVDGCALQLTGAVRDPATHQVKVDSRTTNLQPTGDGYGVSGGSTLGVSAANFANVAVCPNEWSQSDVDGNPYGLEVTVQDRQGRTLTKALTVVPGCAEPQSAAQCACICRRGYVLGQACDGGVG